MFKIGCFLRIGKESEAAEKPLRKGSFDDKFVLS